MSEQPNPQLTDGNYYWFNGAATIVEIRGGYVTCSDGERVPVASCKGTFHPVPQSLDPNPPPPSDPRWREIKEREAKASPGPWFVVNNPSRSDSVCSVVVRSNRDDAGTDLFDTRNRGYKVSLVEHDGYHWQDKAGLPDMEFAAHAREDIPWLLDALAAAEAKAEAIEKLPKRGDKMWWFDEEDRKAYPVIVIGGPEAWTVPIKMLMHNGSRSIGIPVNRLHKTAQAALAAAGA
jgi:hypothetical protein